MRTVIVIPELHGSIAPNSVAHAEETTRGKRKRHPHGPEGTASPDHFRSHPRKLVVSPHRTGTCTNRGYVEAHLRPVIASKRSVGARKPPFRGGKPSFRADEMTDGGACTRVVRGRGSLMPMNWPLAPKADPSAFLLPFRVLFSVPLCLCVRPAFSAVSHTAALFPISIGPYAIANVAKAAIHATPAAVMPHLYSSGTIAAPTRHTAAAITSP